MDHLTEEQRQSVAQLRDLTNGGNDEVSISILESVGWDVQRAVEVIFDAGSNSHVAPAASSSTSHIERFEVDDAEQGGANGAVRQPPPTWSLTFSSSTLMSLLAFPFHVLSNIFRFIFGVLRIPIPQFRFTGLNFYRPLRPRPTTTRGGGPDRWVRDLEEETGAVCIGGLRTPNVMASGADAGPSSLNSRARVAAGVSEDGRKLLPDFSLCSYEEALRRCEKEAKVGCIILVSEEHDDVAEFKRSTLTDPAFVKILYDNNVIVWGGDVRDREAWTAAEKLQATTYPFVAFVALQPRRSITTSSTRSTASPPTLTVLSRHQGRSTPTSAPTSAATLVEHIERQLLPRVSAFLERIRSAQRERERDRLLREEQDRAFRDSAQRDRERIEAKMAAEREARARQQRLEEEARAEEAHAAQLAEEKQRRIAARVEWRRWMRRALVTPEAGNSTDGIRIAIRLPGDKRVVHRFEPAATLTALYAFVDSQLIPAELSASDDPAESPNGFSGETAIEQEISAAQSKAEDWWGFKLVLAYPRHDIKWEVGKKLFDLDGLRGGGQVVVELLAGHRQDDGNDDGYSTEESDQE